MIVVDRVIFEVCERPPFIGVRKGEPSGNSFNRSLTSSKKIASSQVTFTDRESHVLTKHSPVYRLVVSAYSVIGALIAAANV
jgi:hypothetical protein